jgi:hypothetical protein
MYRKLYASKDMKILLAEKAIRHTRGRNAFSRAVEESAITKHLVKYLPSVASTTSIQ